MQKIINDSNIEKEKTDNDKNHIEINKETAISSNINKNKEELENQKIVDSIKYLEIDNDSNSSLNINKDHKNLSLILNSENFFGNKTEQSVFPNVAKDIKYIKNNDSKINIDDLSKINSKKNSNKLESFLVENQNTILESIKLDSNIKESNVLSNSDKIKNNRNSLKKNNLIIENDETNKTSEINANCFTVNSIKENFSKNKAEYNEKTEFELIKITNEESVNININNLDKNNFVTIKNHNQINNIDENHDEINSVLNKDIKEESTTNSNILEINTDKFLILSKDDYAKNSNATKDDSSEVKNSSLKIHYQNESITISNLNNKAFYLENNNINIASNKVFDNFEDFINPWLTEISNARKYQ